MNYNGFKLKRTVFDNEDKFIRCIDYKYYFLDETWGLCGPFNSRNKAVDALKDYYKAKVNDKS